MDEIQLSKLAAKRRSDVVEMIKRAGTGHIGGSMSAMDIVCCLYYDVMEIDLIKDSSPARDRFILSKGHSSECLYATLCDLGFFPHEELLTYAAYATRLPCHPTRKLPGVEASTGALGHGLSLGVGMALGNKRKSLDGHIFVLMGDGEQAEGSNWEAAMSAAKYGLDNLTAIVDRNRLQITGNTEDVMPLDNLFEKYKSFGFNVISINGHDFGELKMALKTVVAGKPTAVIANTIKGRGVSFMENKAEWHHHVPTEEEAKLALAELAKEMRV